MDAADPGRHGRIDRPASPIERLWDRIGRGTRRDAVSDPGAASVDQIQETPMSLDPTNIIWIIAFAIIIWLVWRQFARR